MQLYAAGNMHTVVINKLDCLLYTMVPPDSQCGTAEAVHDLAFLPSLLIPMLYSL